MLKTEKGWRKGMHHTYKRGSGWAAHNQGKVSNKTCN